jgi:hypothetical protein
MTRRSEIRLEEVTQFEEELSTAYRDLPNTHTVNLDESMWLLFWQRRKTVVDTGVKAVKIEIDGDPKAGLTLIGSIVANGDTLPLFVVVKGRTSRLDDQFGPGFPRGISQSKSGWVNSEVFGKYRVSNIRCSTVQHERGCAACPRSEQGKATLRRLAAVKTR